MKTHEFCYWLQGLFEIADPKTLDENQVRIIRAHLDMVFLHDIDKRYPAEQQKALNAIHNGLKVAGKPPVSTSVVQDDDTTLFRC
ncbi:hypothetical protein HOU02_gp558 [Caulobacter phage CcrBL9]|uniref:Uncharacterized protein n=1 Tax=Caulobacter phage CcrBL9 TaxID=2283270 RepID=A0A385EEB4_9CAUD|nr:hypothetical protein HOU02_gp558 [Caulobacter phage CcrBL9]AXQ69167.1 hypothetical protein CcrBL9_gp143 [Caulobacter phage CcrBL9]